MDGSGKCNINFGGSGVHLAIFEIAASEKDALDRCEGLGKGYDELAIQDPSFGSCLTYVANPGAIDETLQPIDWYREMVLLGCKWNGFPDEYSQTIESIQAIEDSVEQRSHEQWKIVEELRSAT